MTKLLSDWKIWLSYILVLLLGILIGYDLTTKTLLTMNIAAWFSAIATFCAVVVALYTTKLNVERDSYRLKCSMEFVLKSERVENSDGFLGSHSTLVKKCFIRCANMGLRPISIDRLRVKKEKYTVELLEFTQTETASGLLENTKLQPGDFVSWSLPKSMFLDKNDEIMDIEVWVIDALQVAHRATKIE